MADTHPEEDVEAPCGRAHLLVWSTVDDPGHHTTVCPINHGVGAWVQPPSLASVDQAGADPCLTCSHLQLCWCRAGHPCGAHLAGSCSDCRDPVFYVGCLIAVCPEARAEIFEDPDVVDRRAFTEDTLLLLLGLLDVQPVASVLVSRRAVEAAGGVRDVSSASC